jgi:NCS1 family nucleobase:cation symporter-1
VWLTLQIFLNFPVAEFWAQPSQGGSFWRGVDLVVALPISWFPLVADYSRFARTPRVALWGTGAGYFVPHVWFYFLGALLVLAGTQINFVEPVVPLLGAIAALTAGWIALLVLLVVEADEAFANVYSTSLSIQNWFPRANHRSLIIGICAFVLVVALMVPLTHYEAFLLLIGAIFVPLLAVLAADYFIVNRQEYEAAALYDPSGRYRYQGGFNVEAIIVWLLGVVLFIALAGLPTNLGDIVGPWFGMETLVIGGLAPQIGGTLPSFIAVFVAHALLGRISAPRPIAEAARP